MIFSLLFTGAVALNALLIFLGNGASFPLNGFDFWFLSCLAFGFSLFRPGWSFLIFLSILPFETINLAPEVLGIAVRPYQLFALVIFAAIIIRRSVGRLGFSFSFHWFDVLVVVFSVGGFVSALFADQLAAAFKQAIVACFFGVLYFLSRQFLSRKEDMYRVVPFLMLSGVLVGVYAIVQNVWFSRGMNLFEAMPGRPNAFFPEADWLGMYLIFLGSLAFAGMSMSWRGRNVARSGKVSLNSSGKILHRKLNLAGSRQWLAVLIEETIQKWSAHMSLLSEWLSWYSSFGTAFFFLLTFFISISAIILTVARSAWIGMIAAMFVGFGITVFLKRKEMLAWRNITMFGFLMSVGTLLSIGFVWFFHLTSFELEERTISAASGWQSITVSCSSSVALPERINSINELSVYSCWFIRLEEIESEQLAGHSIQRILRPDPSIRARQEIFSTVAEQIREHWALGIGWGSIGSVLGTDDRGSKLNASNAFLEVWLGGGLFAFLAFLILWFLVPIFSLIRIFTPRKYSEEKTIALFFLVSWVGFSCFNLFNSGIFLGFVWVWLGGIGLIAPNKS